MFPEGKAGKTVGCTVVSGFFLRSAGINAKKYKKQSNDAKSRSIRNLVFTQSVLHTTQSCAKFRRILVGGSSMNMKRFVRCLSLAVATVLLVAAFVPFAQAEEN